MEQIINDYKLIEENGKKSLLKFNIKYNVWIKLSFSDVTESNSIIKILSNQYINSFKI